MGIGHDGLRGGVPSYGVSVASRKRLAPDVAVSGLIAAYGAHESRTARDRCDGPAEVIARGSAKLIAAGPAKQIH